MIEALVFDFDGVVIDTETPDYLTWQQTFESYGVELERSLWTQSIGGGEGDFDFYRHLEELSGRRVDREAVRAGRRSRYLEMVRNNPLLPGVESYITQAKGMGLRLGIASSSDRRWVEGHLEERGLIRHFDVVKCRDDVSRAKPDPELYVSAVESLGAQPENAIAIEDSAIGVTAAKRAGLFCVVVPNQITRELPTDHADLRLNSLADLPLERLLSMAANRSG